MSAAPAGPLLEVRNLTKHYPVRRGVFSQVSGQVHAVDDVSFWIAEGETLGLVVDLPQPLSPTRPRVSPSAIQKLTSSTACTCPLTCENTPLRTG